MHSQGIARAKGREEVRLQRGMLCWQGINACTHSPVTLTQIHWDFQSILAREREDKLRRQRSNGRKETEIQTASDQKSCLSSTYSCFLLHSHNHLFLISSSEQGLSLEPSAVSDELQQRLEPLRNLVPSPWHEARGRL